MKADLYVQGKFWATVQIHGPSFAEFLAAGMVTHAEGIAQLLNDHLVDFEKARCSISLRLKDTVPYTPPAGP